jgi:hypothetical protein
MKLKLLSVFVAATAAVTSTSNAVTLSLAGLASTSVGLITLDPDNRAPFPPGSLVDTAPRVTVSGRAIFVSVTDSLTGVAASMNSLLEATTSTGAQFDSALATLIGVTSSTDPGIVRSTTFTNGALSSTGATELGAVGNKTYLFLVAEAGGFITGIGAYTGANVASAGAVTINPTTAGDTLLVGTSVLAAAGGGQPISGFQLAAAVPEPSAALLGALGALGLLRRRRI